MPNDEKPKSVVLEMQPDEPQPKKRGRKPGQKNRVNAQKAKPKKEFDFKGLTEMLFSAQPDKIGLMAKNRPWWGLQQQEIDTFNEALKDFIEESGGIESLSAKHVFLITSTMIFAPRGFIEVKIFLENQKQKKLAKPVSKGTVKKSPETETAEKNGKKE